MVRERSVSRIGFESVIRFSLWISSSLYSVDSFFEKSSGGVDVGKVGFLPSFLPFSSPQTVPFGGFRCFP